MNEKTTPQALTVADAFEAAKKVSEELAAQFEQSPTSSIAIAWIDSVVRVRQLAVDAAGAFGNALLTAAVEASFEGCPNDHGMLKVVIRDHGLILTEPVTGAEAEPPGESDTLAEATTTGES